MKKIIFQEIIPGLGFDFNTGNGSIIKSEDITGPFIFRIRRIWELRREKRLGYRIDFYIEEFQKRQLIQDNSKEGSIKIKITRKKIRFLKNSSRFMNIPFKNGCDSLSALVTLWLPSRIRTI